MIRKFTTIASSVSPGVEWKKGDTVTSYMLCIIVYHVRHQDCIVTYTHLQLYSVFTINS